MMAQPGAIYRGKVIHKRLRPCVHKLNYSVFALLLDCAHLDKLSSSLTLFSRNSLNLFSLYDRDYGDGTGIEKYLQSIAGQAGCAVSVDRFLILTYPRILGYAFNPMTTYYGLAPSGEVVLMIYEVNNTFGERQTYVLPATPNNDGLVAQNCSKRFYVSPFNTDQGHYSFRVSTPAQTLSLGVALRDEAGPVMRATFFAERVTLTDLNLLKMLAQTGWMTAKVTIGIHLEAARLWLKGLTLKPRPSKQKHEVAFGD